MFSSGLCNFYTYVQVKVQSLDSAHSHMTASNPIMFFINYALSKNLNRKNAKLSTHWQIHSNITKQRYYQHLIEFRHHHPDIKVHFWVTLWDQSVPFALNLQKPHLLYFWTADPGPASISKQPESQNHKLNTPYSCRNGWCFFFFFLSERCRSVCEQPVIYLNLSC